MSGIKDTLQFAWEGADVHRFHTRPGLRPATDGQHMWGVALLCHFLSEPPGASATLLMAAITHDLAEHVVGDVPRPTKLRVPGLAIELDALEDKARASYGLDFPLEPTELRTLKLADALDGMLWCAREAGLGSGMSKAIYHHWQEDLPALLSCNPSKRELAVVGAVAGIWTESISLDGPRRFIYG